MDKTILTLLGIVFVVVGILGFFNDPVLGVFDVDMLHNVIHVLSGVLLLGAVGMGTDVMHTYAKIFGVIYGVVAAIGFFTAGDMILGLFASNFADDVLHLVLAVVLLYFGYGRVESHTPAEAAM